MAIVPGMNCGNEGTYERSHDPSKPSQSSDVKDGRFSIRR